MNATCWIYRKTEPQLWTVAFYDGAGKWTAENDYATPEAAAARVHYLNGGNHPGYEELVTALRLARQAITTLARRIPVENAEIEDIAALDEAERADLAAQAALRKAGLLP